MTQSTPYSPKKVRKEYIRGSSPLPVHSKSFEDSFNLFQRSLIGHGALSISGTFPSPQEGPGSSQARGEGSNGLVVLQSNLIGKATLKEQFLLLNFGIQLGSTQAERKPVLQT